MADSNSVDAEIESCLFLHCPLGNQTEVGAFLQCDKSISLKAPNESVCKKELLKNISESRDKLFFVLFYLDGPDKEPEKEPTSFLIQTDPYRLPEEEEEVDGPHAFHCTFFLEHPDDIDKVNTKKRFWFRWQKYYAKTDTLSKDMTLFHPNQTKIATKRSYLVWEEWLDLTDPSVCIHGPFDFGSNSKNMPTYCIRQKDWDKLPGKVLSSQVFEKNRIGRKRIKLNDDKTEAYVGGKTLSIKKFYYMKESNADSKILYYLTEIKKEHNKEYCGICAEYISTKVTNGLYVKINSSSISIPLAALHEEKTSRCRASNISSYIYCPPERKQRFHFAYYLDQCVEKNKLQLNQLPKILDLFCGAGGMSTGFALAGVETRWAVDQDQYSSATYKASTHGRNTQVYCESISCFFKNVRGSRAGYPKKGEVDHIHASPPCQGFSIENRHGGSNDQENKDLSHSFTESIDIFRPKTATMENVLGILQAQHANYIDSIVQKLISMEYQVRCVVLNAKNYGDPQSRRRFIIFAAHKYCELPRIPDVTHGAGTSRPYNTVASAIDFLERFPPDNDGGAGTFQMSDGTFIFNHSGSKITPTIEDLRLVGNKPANTITCNCKRVHHKAERYLTVREAASLQSFPANYQFFGSKESMYRQVGNAVPVRLARAIARSVLTSHEA